MRPLVYNLGLILIVMGLVMSVPAIAALILGESFLIKYFLLPAVTVIFVGFGIKRYVKKKELDFSMAFMVSALAWLLIPLIGAIPVYFIMDTSPIESYFEAMAGFTTTGITAITPSEAPRTLLFWRSLMEWIGGVGVVLLFLAIVGPTNVASKLYKAEGRSERLEPSIAHTADAIFYIYAYLTLLGILFMYLAGLPVFEAVNHGMTAIATGGFSTFDDSFTQLPLAVKIVGMVLMFAGAVSFALHRGWLSKDYKSLLNSLEVRTMTLIIIIGALLLTWDGVTFVDALFNVISGITTTGFNSGDVSGYNDFSKYVLVLLINIGGGYGSTASGIKLIRFLILLKAVQWYIKKITSPSRTIIPFKIRNKVFSEDEVFTTLLYTFLHFAFLAIGIMVFMGLGNTLMDSLFMISSAQANNGLVIMSTHTDVEKIVMIFHMWIGRLEIIPVLALFMGLLKKRK